jgi:hypothetical protein
MAAGTTFVFHKHPDSRRSAIDIDTASKAVPPALQKPTTASSSLAFWGLLHFAHVGVDGKEVGRRPQGTGTFVLLVARAGRANLCP